MSSRSWQLFYLRESKVADEIAVLLDALRARVELETMIMLEATVALDASSIDDEDTALLGLIWPSSAAGE